MPADAPLTTKGNRMRNGLALIALLVWSLVVTACSASPANLEFIRSFNLLEPQQRSMELIVEKPAPDATTSGWITQGNAAIKVTSEHASVGDRSLRVVGSTSDPVWVDGEDTIRVATVPGVSVREGRMYGGGAHVLMDDRAVPVRCEIRFYGSDGRIVETVPGPQKDTEPGEWVMPACFGAAPAGAVTAALRVHASGVGPGDVFYVDDAILVDIEEIRAALDAASASPTPAIGPASPSTTEPPTTTGPAPTTTAVPTTTAAPPPTATSPTDMSPPTSSAPTTTPADSSAAPRTKEQAVDMSRLSGYVDWTDVGAGETKVLRDTTVRILYVRSGADVTLDNVVVNGGIWIYQTPGEPPAKIRINNSAFMSESRLQIGRSPRYDVDYRMDMVVNDSFFYSPAGVKPQHMDAFQSLGWPTGVVFNRVGFAMGGPYNGTQTAPLNWKGKNTSFNEIWVGFLPGNSAASYYSIYEDGTNNVYSCMTATPGLTGAVFYPSTGNPVVKGC